MNDFQQTAGNGTSSNFIIHVQKGNWTPISSIQAVPLLKSQSNDTSALRERQRTRTIARVKNIHQVRTQNTPKLHVKLHWKTIQTGGLTMGHTNKSLMAFIHRKGALTFQGLTWGQSRRDITQQLLLSNGVSRRRRKERRIERRKGKTQVSRGGHNRTVLISQRRDPSISPSLLFQTEKIS